ncbi:PsbP domain-containing protein 7 [Durusdinium trenchii]|uniref:Chloroplastic (Photosystem II reaction center PsbP family protein) n=1 Tax=Durusdinium trenchii TaxID=1381693 RepID=A0ABP0QC68_9DINO
MASSCSEPRRLRLRATRSRRLAPFVMLVTVLPLCFTSPRVPRGTAGAGAGRAARSERPEDAEDVSVSSRGEGSEAEAPKVAAEEESLWTYIFGKPGELRRDLNLVGTTPERIIVTNLLAILIGLASNLWGQTEFLLRTVPVLGAKARELHLDSLYAVDGLKTAYEDQYQARYPSTWLLDQRVALLKARQSSPDDLLGISKRSAMPEGVVPDNAWGPPGGGDRSLKKRENLSVVKQILPPKAPGQPQEISEILGEPSASLERLLRETIAPEGSKKTVEALMARRLEKAGNTYYEYQWRTTFPSGVSLRSYSSCSLGPPDARQNRQLYTLTLVLPDAESDASADNAAALAPAIVEGFQVASGAE